MIYIYTLIYMIYIHTYIYIHANIHSKIKLCPFCKKFPNCCNERYSAHGGIKFHFLD